ncbi:hypothetical protein Neut_1747 [Nitrosomonas eutropha C91]|uniref:DDE family transposase n=1 Tax=Nitrosomonas eutropha (strain DSM 101675 / C91 / Nm57) TaxID=335283 RepID=Q0AFA0_NITEC|nr:hypothetical protein Neut_1747 [Nitrosomonas eutropha C91]
MSWTWSGFSSMVTISRLTSVGAAQSIVADIGYDSQAIRDSIKQQGAKAVIPGKRNSKTSNVDLD